MRRLPFPFTAEPSEQLDLSRLWNPDGERILDVQLMWGHQDRELARVRYNRHFGFKARRLG